jgi:hypothetical protein
MSVYLCFKSGISSVFVHFYSLVAYFLNYAHRGLIIFKELVIARNVAFFNFYTSTLSSSASAV